MLLPFTASGGEQKAWMMNSNTSYCEVFRHLHGTEHLPKKCTFRSKPRCFGCSASSRTPFAKKDAPPIPAGPVAAPVFFDFDSTVLSVQSRQNLDVLGAVMRDSGSSYLMVGHCDRQGSDAYNMDLSMRRARAAQQYLQQQWGIDAQNMQVSGSGFRDLYDPQHPYDGSNRRVEFSVLASSGG